MRRNKLAHQDTPKATNISRAVGFNWVQVETSNKTYRRSAFSLANTVHRAYGMLMRVG